MTSIGALPKAVASHGRSQLDSYHMVPSKPFPRKPVGVAPKCREVRKGELHGLRSAGSTCSTKATSGQVDTAVVTISPQGPPPDLTPAVEVNLSLIPVTASVTQLCCECLERLKYEIEFARKRGSTDNCYLIKGESGSVEVMVDVPDNAYAQQMVSVLSEGGVAGTLRALVISHLTPKRLDSLKALLELVKGAGGSLEIHLSNPALQVLRALMGGDDASAALLSGVTLQVARPGSTLSLGSSAGAAELRFLPAPTPRWPDLLMTYLPQERLLLSSKFFSAHVAPSLVQVEEGAKAFDEGGWGLYGDDWRYYFDCMLAPVARQAAATLERLSLRVTPAGTRTLGLESGWLLAGLRGVLANMGLLTSAQEGSGSSAEEVVLDVTWLCPLHGPVVRFTTAELVRQYSDWTANQVAATEQCGVLVLYASAYGNTAALAQAISRGITKAGVGVEQLNLELASLAEVEAALVRAQGFVIGSPTLGGHMPTQVQTALGTILRLAEARNLPCGVFGSFGWSGEAVDEMEAKLKDAGFSFAFPPVRCKFKPTAAVLQVCEESGTDLAQRVRTIKRRKDKVAGGGTPTVLGGSGAEAALGRVVGSLCVVSARDGDAGSGMLASWISQASFDPPGLTVAVKKDRAVEPLLDKGGKFVLNILADGKEKAVMKHMLKSFAPGEDRFAGLPTQTSPGSGCPVLLDSAAYLECSTVQRMEAGDHWVVYAQVDSGAVVDEGAVAAVHHRKIGTSY